MGNFLDTNPLLTQEVQGRVTAHLVLDFLEGGALCGKSSPQRLRMYV